MLVKFSQRLKKVHKHFLHQISSKNETFNKKKILKQLHSGALELLKDPSYDLG